MFWETLRLTRLTWIGEEGFGGAAKEGGSGLQVVFNVERQCGHHLGGCALVSRLAHPAKRQDTVFRGHGIDFGECAENLAVIFVKGDALHRLTSELDYRQTS